MTIGSPTHEADTLAPLQVRAEVYTDVTRGVLATQLSSAVQQSTALVSDDLAVQKSTELVDE